MWLCTCNSATEGRVTVGCQSCHADTSRCANLSASGLCTQITLHHTSTVQCSAAQCCTIQYVQTRQIVTAGMDNQPGHMTACRCLRPKATRSVAFFWMFLVCCKERAEAVQQFLQPPQQKRWMTAPIWYTLIASTSI